MSRSPFTPNSQRSSDIEIIPAPGSIVRKIKTNRTEQKMLHEHFALLVYEALLEGSPDFTTPKAYGYSVEGSFIDMGFVPGLEINRLLSGNVGVSLPKSQRIEHTKATLSKIGVLARLKEHYKLVHGDFQLRHLLSDTDTGKIGIIDVENSFVGDMELVSKESTRILDAIKKALNNQSRVLSVDELFEQGYYSKPSYNRDIHDIISEARHKSGVSASFYENPKK